MEVHAETIKTCSSCKRGKALDFFPKDKRRADGKYIYCKSCAAEKSKQGYQSNIDHCRNLKRDQARKFSDENKARHKSWYETNKEKRQAQTSEYQKSDLDRTRAYSRAYSDRNREKRRASGRAYFQSEKGKMARSHQNSMRSFRLRGSGGSHTLVEWNNLKALHNYICKNCGKQEPEIKLTRDHIIPVSKGGHSNIDNIQPLCQRCNSAKKDKL